MPKRLIFDFSEEARKDLDEIRKMGGFSSNAHTVQQALRLFRWSKEKIDEGHTLLIQYPSGELRAIVAQKVFPNL